MLICYKCQEPIDPANAVVDHIVPLHRGGSNGDDNTRLMHRTCHAGCKPSRLQYYIGKALCWIGQHRWRPLKGTIRLDWRSKWEAYEVADGVCGRGCGAEAEIRRDYYW